MKLLIASDHAGFELKQFLKESCADIDWQDQGCFSKDSVDYPDFADKLCRQVDSSTKVQGILICGSGQGMSIRANKYQTVRAALCWNVEIAELARQHNAANVLCLGSRFVSNTLAIEILKKFISTEFEGGRHQMRVDKIGQKITGDHHDEKP